MCFTYEPITENDISCNNNINERYKVLQQFCNYIINLEHTIVMLS